MTEILFSEAIWTNNICKETEKYVNDVMLCYSLENLPDFKCSSYELDGEIPVVFMEIDKYLEVELRRDSGKIENVQVLYDRKFRDADDSPIYYMTLAIAFYRNAKSHGLLKPNEDRFAKSAWVVDGVSVWESSYFFSNYKDMFFGNHDKKLIHNGRHYQILKRSTQADLDETNKTRKWDFRLIRENIVDIYCEACSRVDSSEAYDFFHGFAEASGMFDNIEREIKAFIVKNEIKDPFKRNAVKDKKSGLSEKMDSKVLSEIMGSKNDPSKQFEDLISEASKIRNEFSDLSSRLLDGDCIGNVKVHDLIFDRMRVLLSEYQAVSTLIGRATLDLNFDQIEEPVSREVVEVSTPFDEDLGVDPKEDTEVAPKHQFPVKKTVLLLGGNRNEYLEKAIANHGILFEWPDVTGSKGKGKSMDSIAKRVENNQYDGVILMLWGGVKHTVSWAIDPACEKSGTKIFRLGKNRGINNVIDNILKITGELDK
tara:strand:- start:83649 stop:85097 length:1449 start_codon:yes stop_codon:yes gene_type:complete